MNHLLTLILTLTLLSNISAQTNLKNSVDVRLGYGGIDKLSGMTFLSAAFGRDIKNGFILKATYLTGSGVEDYSGSGEYYSHGSINIYGIGLQKAVNMSGSSSINLGLGYRFASLNKTAGQNTSFESGKNFDFHRQYHGVDVDLSYSVNFNDRFGIYAGANFMTGIFMFSINVGSRVYF